MKLNTKIILLALLAGSLATSSLLAANNTARDAIKREQQPYLEALATAEQALPYDITNDVAQAALNALPSEKYLLRLAYQFVWSFKRDFSNLAADIDMSKVLSINQFEIRLNFASLNNHPNRIPLQQELIALACCICDEQGIIELRVQNINGLQQVTCNSAKIRNLLVLDNPTMTSLTINCPALESLQVKNNAAMTSLTINCPSLTFLKAIRNTAITALTINCPALIDLEAIDNTAITSLTINSPALTGLCVSGNHAMTSLTLNCPALRRLDAFSNQQLINVTTCAEMPSLNLYHKQELKDLINENRAGKKLSKIENILVVTAKR